MIHHLLAWMSQPQLFQFQLGESSGSTISPISLSSRVTVLSLVISAGPSSCGMSSVLITLVSTSLSSTSEWVWSCGGQGNLLTLGQVRKHEGLLGSWHIQGRFLSLFLPLLLAAAVLSLSHWSLAANLGRLCSSPPSSLWWSRAVTVNKAQLEIQTRTKCGKVSGNLISMFSMTPLR